MIACIALFVSLGGVSYGVATGFIDSREIKNNTSRSGDVRNNTLRTFDIRNNEVRGFDIRNSTIQGRDVAFNTLTGADIARVRASARCRAPRRRTRAATVEPIAPTTVGRGVASGVLAKSAPRAARDRAPARGDFGGSTARLHGQAGDAALADRSDRRHDRSAGGAAVARR